jgi:hypothetical protein
MVDETLPYIPVVVTKHEEGPDAQPMPWNPRPYMAQVIANPQLRADGETRDDALKRLKGLLRSHFFCGPNSDEFEVVNMDLNEILVEEVMNG